MKILLDENIDVRYKKQFSTDTYEVYTVSDMGWNGVKNGSLLKLLEQQNFDCFIIVDKNLPYQQNMTTLPCQIIVLDVFRNTLKHIIPLTSSVIAHLHTIEKKVVVISENG